MKKIHPLTSVLALMVLSTIALMPLPLNHVQASEKAGKKAAVRLIIDYGDGVQKVYKALPWKKGMTVLDATVDASSHKRGIKLKYRSSGSTAFVTQIDDAANEGLGSGKRNWLFKVNRKLATVGAGTHKLSTSDVVLWEYTDHTP